MGHTAVLSVRPSSARAAAGTVLRIAGCIPSFFTRKKGALGPLLSALVGASKRVTPTLQILLKALTVVEKKVLICTVHVGTCIQE